MVAAANRNAETSMNALVAAFGDERSSGGSGVGSRSIWAREEPAASAIKARSTCARSSKARAQTWWQPSASGAMMCRRGGGVGERAMHTPDQQMAGSRLLTRRTDELIAAVNGSAHPVRALSALTGQQCARGRRFQRSSRTSPTSPIVGGDDEALLKWFI
jgi:hypothetical protein